MKSIATELVNDISINWEDLQIRYTYYTKAKAHALTYKTILENYTMRENDIFCSDKEHILRWCESEIKILKDGGLI